MTAKKTAKVNNLDNMQGMLQTLKLEALLIVSALEKSKFSK